MKYLLKNGTVVTGEKSEQLDILVEGEKIVQATAQQRYFNGY